MKKDDIRIGRRVKVNVEFSGVPKGTMGVIDEDYGTGFMVAWDLPDQPLPKGYNSFDGKPAFVSGILRDGFSKENELHFLDVI